MILNYKIIIETSIIFKFFPQQTSSVARRIQFETKHKTEGKVDLAALLREAEDNWKDENRYGTKKVYYCNFLLSIIILT